jgi:hypothetical protein
MSINNKTSLYKKRKTESGTALLVQETVMSTEEKQSIDFLLSNFIFGCNIPLSIVKNPLFRDLIKALNSKYSMPCTETLSTTLLDKRFDQLSEKREDEVKATLFLDGWTNSVTHRKYVVAMAKPRGSGYEELIESFDFTDVSGNAENLKQVILKSTEIAKEKKNFIIDSIGTDNEPAMRRATKDSNLVNFGCMSHIADLMINDLHDKELESQIKKVLVCFRKPNLQDRVIKNGGSVMILRGETR